MVWPAKASIRRPCSLNPVQTKVYLEFAVTKLQDYSTVVAPGHGAASARSEASFHISRVMSTQTVASQDVKRPHRSKPSAT